MCRGSRKPDGAPLVWGDDGHQAALSPAWTGERAARTVCGSGFPPDPWAAIAPLFSALPAAKQSGLNRNKNGLIALLGAGILLADQATKFAVLRYLPAPYESEFHILPGFFRLVHWHNTGAAWSMFHDNNLVLGIVSAVAFVVLILSRKWFGAATTPGATALGLLLGGIAGNLIDRIIHHHVVDFLLFHLITRRGVEHQFPAFNVADSAICIGTGLLFYLSWRTEQAPPGESSTAKAGA